MRHRANRFGLCGGDGQGFPQSRRFLQHCYLQISSCKGLTRIWTFVIYTNSSPLGSMQKRRESRRQKESLSVVFVEIKYVFHIWGCEAPYQSNAVPGPFFLVCITKSHCLGATMHPSHAFINAIARFFISLFCCLPYAIGAKEPPIDNS